MPRRKKTDGGSLRESVTGGKDSFSSSSSLSSSCSAGLRSQLARTRTSRSLTAKRLDCARFIAAFGREWLGSQPHRPDDTSGAGVKAAMNRAQSKRWRGAQRGLLSNQDVSGLWCFLTAGRWHSAAVGEETFAVFRPPAAVHAWAADRGARPVCAIPPSARPACGPNAA